MYPWQHKIIDGFLEKFSATRYGIETFIRNHRLKKAPEEKICPTKSHKIILGSTLYFFNGEPCNLKSFFCSDLKCFLENIDANSVNVAKTLLKTKPSVLPLTK